MYWIVTNDGSLGPYDDYEAAYFAATINYGFSNWRIIVER